MFLVQCSFRYSIVTNTFTICILNEPNIFTPYFRLTVCARNDLGRPTFQSDSFLTHTFSTEISIFLLYETLIDILNSDNTLLTS